MDDYVSRIPQITKESLDRYARGFPTGGFLKAVLENNLMEAMSSADASNREALYEIVMYVYNKMPMDCWGSPEKVKRWLKTKREEANGIQ